MSRPTRPPHYGTVSNPRTFNQALRNLQISGPQNLTTAKRHTPFTAAAHVTKGGNHNGQDCIKVTRNGKPRAYIYSCCWDHITNCSGTYIDVYSPLL